MPSRRFFPFLFIFLLFRFSSAARFRCRPEDAEQLQYIYHMPGPVTDCCMMHVVRCNKSTNWVESLTVRGDETFTEVPPALGKITTLLVLILHKLPNLRGEISPEIAKLTKLTYLKITYTNVTGPIPALIGSLKQLEYLDLSFNHLSGSIPPFLGEMPKVAWLRLDRNGLTGPIPDSFGRFKGNKLQLGFNSLSGDVPKSLGDVDFVQIELMRNGLTGDPSHLFNNRSKSLETIDLSRNLFQFDLTGTVFPAKTLSSIDLSHNKIRGSIPSDVVVAGNLVYMNVSYNQLCGKIPQGGRVQELPSSSFVHNRCLCGLPLPNTC